MSAWLWAEKWKGHLVYVFCDNTAVVELLEKDRPKDLRIIELFQEYLYIVSTRGFTPVFMKVGTKENLFADFISRSMIQLPQLLTSETRVSQCVHQSLSLTTCSN